MSYRHCEELCSEAIHAGKSPRLATQGDPLLQRGLSLTLFFKEGRRRRRRGDFMDCHACCARNDVFS